MSASEAREMATMAWAAGTVVGKAAPMVVKVEVSVSASTRK
jgi:hypothetical protein